MKMLKGTKHTEETKEKMSIIKKLNHPRGMLNKHHSQESKQKIRFQNIGKLVTEETKIKLKLINLGKKLSYETKQKISKANKGKHLSFEHKKKISLSSIGKIMSNEAREKIRKARMKRKFPLKDSSIELKIQDGLEKLNVEFITHKPILNITQPDIFIEPNVCVYADGCYWHGCEKCFDRNKFDGRVKAQKIKDLLITEKLQKEGYTVLRFWEHDINENFEDKVLDEIVFTLNDIKMKLEGFNMAGSEI